LPADTAERKRVQFQKLFWVILLKYVASETETRRNGSRDESLDQNLRLIGGLYVCLGVFKFVQNGLDIQIWQKFHGFIVFHISIWGGLELCLGGLSPPKPPVTTGLL